jgi:hypothetical protein
MTLDAIISAIDAEITRLQKARDPSRNKGMMWTIATLASFPGNRAKAESQILSVPFRFGGQRRYRGMRLGLGKVPVALLEL